MDQGPNALDLNALPEEMLLEIVNRSDAPSSLCLALASQTLFKAIGSLCCSKLLGIKFSQEMCYYGYSNQLAWLEPESVSSSRYRWSHAYKAARGGHLSLLRFLSSVRGVMLDSPIADAAARNADIPTLDYLYKKGVEYSATTFLELGKSGSIDAVVWAEETLHFLSHLRPNAFVYYLFMGAVRCGKLDLLKYITNSWNGMPSSIHLVEAAQYGQVGLFDWIYDAIAARSPEALAEINFSLPRIAAYPQFIVLLNYLIRRNYPLNIQTTGMAILMFSNFEAFELLSNRFDITPYLNEFIRVPIAVYSVEGFKSLLSKGAKVNDGIVQLALSSRYMPLINFLRDEKLISAYQYGSLDQLYRDGDGDFRFIDAEIPDFFELKGHRPNSEAVLAAIREGYSLDFIRFLQSSLSCPITREAIIELIRTRPYERLSDLSQIILEAQVDTVGDAELREIAEEEGNFDLSEFIRKGALRQKKAEFRLFRKLCAGKTTHDEVSASDNDDSDNDDDLENQDVFNDSASFELDFGSQPSTDSSSHDDDEFKIEVEDADVPDGNLSD